MRIIALNKVLERLKTNQLATLFGIHTEDGLIITTSQRDGLEPVQVDVVDYETDFQARNQGLIDKSELQGKRVSVLGLGSGGSKIAVSLTRSGVTNFCIIDNDIVEGPNVSRSEYDLSDVGRKKTKALRDKLLRINPYVSVRTIDEDIMGIDDELLDFIVASDLIIEATDNYNTKLLINGMAYSRIPVIYPAVYDLGRGGEVLFTIPGVTPCLECVLSSILPQMDKTGVERGEWDYSSGGTKPMAGLTADIDVVAARAVKLALALLLEGTEKAFLENVTEQGCSILFIGNEKDFFIFNEPFQEIWGKTEVDPECTCQTLR
jgi:molybdopterin/thiamine biosynthesis adenylyltransferase